MIFPTLSTSLLGFVTLAVAAPHLHSRFENEVAVREVGPVVERGMIWQPRQPYRRDNKGKNNNGASIVDIAIQETSITQINSGTRSNDIILVQQIQKESIIIDNSETFKDNVRKNTFKNKNKDKNTIIIVVTEIIDVRDSKNSNKRYKTKQLESNKDIQEQVIIVISDSQQLTVDGSKGGKDGPTAVASAFTADSTGSSQVFQQYDPNAAASFLGDGAQAILPSGAAAPQWSNAKNSADPADILILGKEAFVSFVGEESNNDVVITVAVSS